MDKDVTQLFSPNTFIMPHFLGRGVGIIKPNKNKIFYTHKAWNMKHRKYISQGLLSSLVYDI